MSPQFNSNISGPYTTGFVTTSIFDSQKTRPRNTQCLSIDTLPKEVPVLLKKRILKDTLRGLAALHEQNVVHNGKLYSLAKNNLSCD